MHTFVSSSPGKPIYKSFLCSNAARSGVKSTIKQNLELSRVTISGHLPFLIPPHDSPLAVISMNSDGIHEIRTDGSLDIFQVRTVKRKQYITAP